MLLGLAQSGLHTRYGSTTSGQVKFEGNFVDHHRLLALASAMPNSCLTVVGDDGAAAALHAVTAASPPLRTSLAPPCSVLLLKQQRHIVGAACTLTPDLHLHATRLHEARQGVRDPPDPWTLTYTGKCSGGFTCVQNVTVWSGPRPLTHPATLPAAAGPPQRGRPLHHTQRCLFIVLVPPPSSLLLTVEHSLSLLLQASCNNLTQRPQQHQ